MQPPMPRSVLPTRSLQQTEPLKTHDQQQRARRKSLKERMRSACCRKSTFRLSLRTTISLLLISFITLTCTLQWYLGYNNLNRTISDFTFLHRRATLALVQSSVQANLQLPVKAVGQVTALLKSRFTAADFRHNANLSTARGFLEDVDFVFNQLGASYVEGMGYGTAAGFYAHRQVLRSNEESFMPSTNVTMGFAWSEPDAQGLNTIYDFNLTSAQPDPLKPACTPVALMPKDQMIEVLNPAYNSFSGYTPVTRPWYNAGVVASGAITWTAPFKLLSVLAETTVVATVQGIVDPSNGEVVAVTWAFCYLHHITQLIASLDVGPNGMVLLFDPSGMILSSSNLEFAGLSGNIRLQESSDEILQTVAQAFANSGSGIPQITNSSLFDLSRLPTNAPIRVNGRRFHLSSTTVTAPGVTWILVVLTLDSDWTGAVDATNRDTALMGLAILLGAFLVSWCITSSMILPMKAMIMFMKEFGVMTLAAGGIDEDGEANESETKSPPDFEHLFQMWKLAMGDQSTKKSNSSTTDLSISTSGRSTFRQNPDGSISFPNNNHGPRKLEAALQRNYLSSISCVQFIEETYMMKEAFSQMLQEAKRAYRELDYQKLARRQFIRYVFHEVRVPLNALLFAMDHVDFLIKEHIEKIERQKTMRLMESKTADAELEWLAEARDMMSIQKEQGIVMSRILNDVLTFQKIEDGALSLEMSVFNLQDLVHSTVHSFAAQFHSAGVEVQVDCTGVDRFHEQLSSSTELSENMFDRSSPAGNHQQSAPPKSYLVVGDRLRIRQVLSNFISNAIKFTDATGRVTVMLDVVPNSFSKRSVSVNEAKQPPSPILGRAVFQLSVIDTGKGMSKEKIKCLFSGSQACKAAKLTPSGLGLSICKRLSDLFGGQIGCSSTLNVGSKFFVTLPLDLHTSFHHSLSAGIGRQVRSSVMTSSFKRPSISGGRNEDSRRMPPTTPQRTHDNVARLLRHANTPSNDYLSYNGSGTPLSLNRTPQARKNTVHVAFDSDGHCEVHSTSVPVGPTEHNPRHEHHRLHQVVSDDLFVQPSSVINNHAPPIYELYDNDDSPTPAFAKLPSYEFKAPSLRNLTNHVPSASPSRSPSASPEPFLHKSPDQKLPPVSGDETAAVVAEEAESARPALFRRSSPPVNASHPLNRRLLVVEDSAPNRKLLMMALKSLGWEVDGVADGLDAIEYFQRIKAAEEQAIENFASLPSGTAAAAHEYVAAVFMDNFMEHVSGVEATRAIRAMGFTLPIIGVTGSAMDEDCKEFIEAGVSTILTKPVGGVKALESTLKSYGLDAGKLIRSKSSAN